MSSWGGVAVGATAVVTLVAGCLDVGLGGHGTKLGAGSRASSKGPLPLWSSCADEDLCDADAARLEGDASVFVRGARFRLSVGDVQPDAPGITRLEAAAPGVVAIDGDVVTATAAGSVTLTGRSTSFTVDGAGEITVVEPEFFSIETAAATSSLTAVAGDYLELRVVADVGLRHVPFAWSVDDDSIASVADQRGNRVVLLARQPGTTTVRAELAGQAVSRELRVTEAP